MTTKSTKHSLFQTTRELLVNKTDLQALTLVGPTRENRVLDTLAVLQLDNGLFIFGSLAEMKCYGNI